MSDSIQHISAYLPPGDGFLPKWLFFISVVSLGNSIQAYTSLAGTRQVYAGSSSSTNLVSSAARSSTTNRPSALPDGIPSSTLKDPSPVTELSARTFGSWTALSSIVRLYAAYNIQDPKVYELALWTFGIAFVHFMSEWLIFGTARWGRGLAGPIFVSTGTGAWMLMQWSWYV